jgi:uncharacterized protein
MAEAQAQPWLGTFVWNELGTRDIASAKSLLATLLGWKAEDRDMGPGGTYTIFKSGEKQVAGGWELKGEKYAGVPTHWLGYVGVEDADATVKTAEKLGMKVTMPPTDIPDVGRFAVLDHPATGTIAILQPKPM